MNRIGLFLLAVGMVAGRQGAAGGTAPPGLTSGTCYADATIGA